MAVADPTIADVAVVNARAVLVNGKAPGVTSLVVVDRLKIRQYQVRVVAAVGTRANDVATVIGIPAMPIICSSREIASRGVLAWTVAIEPS